MWSARAAAHHAGCLEGSPKLRRRRSRRRQRAESARRRARAGAAEAALRSKAAAQANVPRPSRRRSRARVLEPSIADHKHLRPADKFTTKTEAPHRSAAAGPVRVQRESTSTVRWGSTWGGNVRHARHSPARSRASYKAAFWASLLNWLTYFPVESPARLETRVETASRRFKFTRQPGPRDCPRGLVRFLVVLLLCPC